MSAYLRVLLVAIALLPRPAAAQGLTGALVGTIKDAQAGVLPGAIVRLRSPALIGGPATMVANERGQVRFATLPPGFYTLDIELAGFAPLHEDGIWISAGATIERTGVLELAGRAESVVVEGAGSRIEARHPGFGTRISPEDLKTIPTRRSSMFDAIRAAPGISPTSPSSGATTTSGTSTTVSAFGSGTNENQFLIDGTNFTCPCNGVARAEPGVDFIQEIQIQSAGASAEFGNVEGAVINVITRQGGDRFLYDASYYAQAAALTSQPVTLPISGAGGATSGYERDRYRDFTTNLGGPAIRDRLWFFAGYQYLRDYDSQPGADPASPRTYEQNKVFAKLTWRLAPGWQLVQSVHDEVWVNPDPATRVTPFEATLRRNATVPAITFGNLTGTLSPNTVFDVRVGRFVYSQENRPSTGDITRANRRDSVTGVSSGAPPTFGSLVIARTTAKATLNHYRPAFFGADHESKAGVQFERAGHRSATVIPTGVRFLDSGGQKSQSVAADPSNIGGAFFSTAAFASDTIAVGARLTISVGLRFDHIAAISQDLHNLDVQGGETGTITPGLGTLYTWNLLSPRLGVTTKLSANGRTVLRASYGRFSPGVLTGELEPFHPGATTMTTTDFNPASGAYDGAARVVDPRLNLQLDPETRAPVTDEYSLGVDRELGRGLSGSIAYIGKTGRNFIGWTDVGGQYREETRTVNGVTVPVFVLVNSTAARRFRLTNLDEYSLTYNGLVMAVERRRANGWQAFGSYTLSRASGLLPSSGATAAGAQVSTVSPPQPLTFGRDPNDLTNARGRLPNDRPHMFRAMGSVELPRTGVVVTANLQHFSGKPWAATGQIPLVQNSQQRVQLEARGSRRLSSQTLVDLRLSRAIAIGRSARVELLLDVLNALNDSAEEAIATDNLSTPTFGQATLFMDPRRAMLSVRVNLGR